jgi:PleD family two-component response regulator
MINANDSNNSNLILVVDDDKSIRMTISLFLENLGYEVIEAENGQECLDICRYHHPDLILLDAVMPIMNGFTCATQLQILLGDLCPPTIMMTVLDDRESVYKSFDVGITEYILKPIDWSLLTQKIPSLLKSSRKTKILKRQMQELRSLKEGLNSPGFWGTAKYQFC